MRPNSILIITNRLSIPFQFKSVEQILTEL